MSHDHSSPSETDSDLSPIRVMTLADQATERLRNAIQRGSLAPGSQLVERELADKLGMSRVPIREAIHRLVEEGLVKKTAHRGTIVYMPSQREIEEITSVRIVLEQLVAERMIQRWNAEHEATLRAIVDEIRLAVQRKDRRRLAELDTDFHTTTWHIADHTVLMEMTSSLRQRVTRLLYETISLMPDNELPGTIASHEWLIDALKRGNVAAAREEMSRHISAGKARILAAYEKTFADATALINHNATNHSANGASTTNGTEAHTADSNLDPNPTAQVQDQET